MTENKLTEDFIKLSRRDYQVILNVFDEVQQATTQDGEAAGLMKEEVEVREKIQKILINIQKFNANKRRQEVSR